MSEHANHESKGKAGFFAFLEGTGGKAAVIISVVIAVACTVLSGIRFFRVIREETSKDAIQLDENGSYNSKQDVAAYIYKYGHLPPNYMTKEEAQLAGWTGGNLDLVVPGMSIGGDRFFIAYYTGDGLAVTEGRYYTECDVNNIGGEDRGTERILFSSDGLIYYTPDHYVTQELLYGQEVLEEFY